MFQNDVVSSLHTVPPGIRIPVVQQFDPFSTCSTTTKFPSWCLTPTWDSSMDLALLSNPTRKRMPRMMKPLTTRPLLSQPGRGGSCCVPVTSADPSITSAQVIFRAKHVIATLPFLSRLSFHQRSIMDSSPVQLLTDLSI